MIAGITANDISASIDLQDLTEGTHSVPLTITLPEGVSLQNQSINSVDIILTQN